MPFFTEAAAEQYIERNAHRLREPRVYVESGYRNPEWQVLRKTLMWWAEIIEGGA